MNIPEHGCYNCDNTMHSISCWKCKLTGKSVRDIDTCNNWIKDTDF